METMGICGQGNYLFVAWRSVQSDAQMVNTMLNNMDQSSVVFSLLIPVGIIGVSNHVTLLAHIASHTSGLTSTHRIMLFWTQVGSFVELRQNNSLKNMKGNHAFINCFANQY